MKVQFYIFFISSCVFLTCQGNTISKNPEKEARVCTEICSGCGGPSFTENNVCYCYVEKGANNEKCVHNAWKKSNLYGMEWVPIHPPGKVIRKARPVRGSFLDPIVANVFDKNAPGNLNNDILFAENFLRKHPIQRLFKRSIKKDLQAQDLDIFNFVDKNSERKKRVPRSLPNLPNKKSKNLNEIPENFPDEVLLDDSNNLIRQKRTLAPFAAIPKLGSNQGTMHEVILQYPTLNDEEKIQLLFPNTNGLDISHEIYYEESDEVDDDEDEDDNDSTWNRISNSYKPFQSLYTRQIYSADPYLRGSRSLYLLPEHQQNAFMYPYAMTQCRFKFV